MMMAVEDGFLNVDSTAGEIIPSFTDEKSSITLAQMLSHTSGMQPEDPLCLNFKITLEQCVDGLSKLPLQKKPGKSAKILLPLSPPFLYRKPVIRFRFSHVKMLRNINKQIS
jgi:hypothetical protein